MISAKGQVCWRTLSMHPLRKWALLYAGMMAAILMRSPEPGRGSQSAFGFSVPDGWLVNVKT
jgi:hypothetical protein